VHLEKMKKDHDDLELQNQVGAKKIEAWSQKPLMANAKYSSRSGRLKSMPALKWRRGSH
jgi:hypothetical protein